MPSSEPLNDARDALCRGEIIAIKGVGGFHLACDAMNDAAVRELRRRKRRDEKPFAVMVRDLETACTLCHIAEAEAALLSSPERPIVLLRKRDGGRISPAIAPGNRNLGLMLPSSPLHHLLFQKNTRHKTRPPLTHPSPLRGEGQGEGVHESHVFVMTSGNLTDEPIAFANGDAVERLRTIADAFLLHDREIRMRLDDSIARVVADRPGIVRRARGFVPTPIRLAFEMPQILALGTDLKGAICLTKGRSAFLSQHLGDLGNALAHRAFEDAVEHLQELLDIQPEIIACDLHPDYFSTRFARSRFTIHDSRFTAIQHHHAHIASCMAENDLPDERVIGIALDGAGFGPDGTIWGGEILLADYCEYKRAARFKPVPMPGGDAAALEPWRMALAYLHAGDTPHPSLSPRGERARVRGDFASRLLSPAAASTVLQMIEKGINCPPTSSCGRLFDAVAALIGLCIVNAFEGQAAMKLEQIADEGEEGRYRFHIEARSTKHEARNSDPELEIDFSPTISDILDDHRGNAQPGTISARFHNTVVDALVGVCTAVRSDSRFTIHDSRACLSGGCFQNARLTLHLKKRLEAEGFSVYTHSLVPPNDGGIALGQAVVAAHTFRSRKHDTRSTTQS